MTLVSEIRTDDAQRGLCGLVVRCTQHRSRTYLDVADGDGIRTVWVESIPDVEGADWLLRRFKRVHAVRIDVQGPSVRCQVRGTGHRQPVRQPLPVGLALGMVRRGVPAFAVGSTDVGWVTGAGAAAGPAWADIDPADTEPADIEREA
jgi:hypothetical protein